MFVPVAGEVAKGGAAGDERGINAKLVGAGVAALFDFFVAAALGFRRTTVVVDERFGVCVRGDFERMFDGPREAFPVSRLPLPATGSSSGRRGSGLPTSSRASR